MENQNLELRMYGFVPYNISPIQQGIQFGHAVVEYGQMASAPHSGVDIKMRYNDWADNWKTFIILNGGTTNTSISNPGTLNKHLQTLKENNILFSSFYEPDLGDQLTSVVFLVDERVFNREKYPDFEDWLMDTHMNLIESFKDTSGKGVYSIAKIIGEKDSEVYQKWVSFIGGSENLFLRIFLKNFKLA